MFDCIIVGGGIAGLQAAIQLGRYAMHNVCVVDSATGRSTICRKYSNILGYPEGVSGERLRSVGKEQALRYGVRFVHDEITQAHLDPAGSFHMRGKSGFTYDASTALLATGVMDRIPNVPGLRDCLGLTAYVCPDCDGYEIQDRKTLVLGSGDVGADMALTLRDWTNQLLFINHEGDTVSSERLDRLRIAGIGYLRENVREVVSGQDGNFQGVVLEDGRMVEGERAFVAFGGNDVKSTIASQLGARVQENRHVWTDLRTKRTSIPNLWAAGDVAVHSEQVTIAMGEGAQAAIWIHKALQKTKTH